MIFERGDAVRYVRHLPRPNGDPWKREHARLLGYVGIVGAAYPGGDHDGVYGLLIDGVPHPESGRLTLATGWRYGAELQLVPWTAEWRASDGSGDCFSSLRFNDAQDWLTTAITSNTKAWAAAGSGQQRAPASAYRKAARTVRSWTKDPRQGFSPRSTAAGWCHSFSLKPHQERS